MQKKREGKIIYRLFLILLVSICIPIILFSYVSYQISYWRMSEDFKKGKENLNRQMAENIETNFYMMKNQSIALYDYDSISYILNADDLEITNKYIDNYNLVYGNLVSIIQGNLKLDSISLINLEGEVRFYFDRNMAKQNLATVADEEWFWDALKGDGRAVIVEPHNNVYTQKEGKVVSVCRAIFNPYDDTVSGVLKIDQEVSTFEEIFDSISREEGEINLVYSQSGGLFYQSEELRDGEADDILHYVEDIDGEEYGEYPDKLIVTSGRSSQDGWLVVSLIPVKNMSERADFLRIINTWVAAVLVVICAGVSFLISMLINRPIQKLKISMQEFQDGNFQTRVKVDRNDEFGMIAKVFNSMVESIQGLISEKYELKLLKKQAQLENYQSQINPHFLFNTLNSIKTVSMKEKADKTTKMIQYFSDNFRYALNRGVYTVSFREELEYIDKYITLQKMRFGDRIIIKKEIDEDTLENECLRMVLQPIVENVFSHGLEMTSGQGRIEIVAQNMGEEFYIYISNTGSEVSRERMEEINAQLSEDMETYSMKNSDKVGIYNVNARIRHYYGSQYGLKMMHGAEQETTIRIYLPRKRKGEQEKG